MKNLLLLLLAFASFSASAQIISGIYMGKLVNDSTKKVQTYELALSEYRGKITGWSYTTFVSNDTFYYSIKKIKATRTSDQLIVEDDKMIINNFPEAPAKKVHQVNYIRLTNEDTLRTMNGSWETTKTKIYYSLKGGLDVKRGDSSNSSLIGHLKELHLIANDNEQYTTAATTKENKKTPAGKKTTTPETRTAVLENRTAALENNTTAQQDQVTVQENKTRVKSATVSNPETPIVQKQSGSGRNLSNAKPPANRPAVAAFHERKVNPPQTVEISSDSILLSFYDNGVVDGDSISVYMNGENIVSNIKLTATATRKTIQLPNLDEVKLLLVAENLGSIPPNTGLVVIRDGENSYQLNFSADMQTNASIVLRKKKK
jgi:hypothetical protein